LFASADTNVQALLTALQTAFTSNFPAIVTAFVGIAVVLWIVHIALRSLGVRKPSRGM
jgi:uncharacterized membrane protein YeaQ/YmgE (transglycosylase-associated protein family)